MLQSPVIPYPCIMTASFPATRVLRGPGRAFFLRAEHRRCSGETTNTSIGYFIQSRSLFKRLDPDRFLDIRHENEAIAGGSGMTAIQDRVDEFIEIIVVADQLDL